MSAALTGHPTVLAPLSKAWTRASSLRLPTRSRSTLLPPALASRILSPSESDLTLPAELERHIFEIAVTLHPGTMPVLMRVAQRVKEWIEPLLYRVIATYASSPLHVVMDSISPAVFRNHVRHLQFAGSYPAKVLTKILTLCVQTTNIDLYATHIVDGEEMVLACLARLPLQRISFNTTQLFPDPARRDFTHPLFARVTHLDICDLNIENWTAWSGLAQIPHLTHLAFHENFAHPPANRVYRGALDHCPALEVLAISSYSRTLLSNWDFTRQECRDDPRFVMILVRDTMADWVKGAQGYEHFWTAADEAVRLRRLNYVSKILECGE
ncbi:hypothetical protein K438DRAFT_2016119 [Mycena galopus ATCC 62051]|nr:hypothetical protein K438DRAFT_2016119 [Mycena galopus ATCC 62051]